MAINYDNTLIFTKDSAIYGHQSLDEDGFPRDAGNGKVSQVLDLAETQTIDNLKTRISITADSDNSKLYHLNIDDTSVATFEIPAGKFLKNVSYDNSTKSLSFVMSNDTDEETMSVDLSTLMESYIEDSDSDLYKGTWKGSLANGISVIPPTKMHITRKMKHKDVYKMMKKQGIVEGVYDAGYSWGSYDEDGCDFTSTAFTEQPPAFCCMDYDEEKLNVFVPLAIGYTQKEVMYGSSKADKSVVVYSWFGPLFGMWAISSDAYLLLLGIEDESNTSVVTYDGFYILTKAKYEEFMNTEEISSVSGDISYTEYKAKYLVKQTAIKDDLYIALNKSALVLNLYPYYDPETLTFHMLTDNVDTYKVHHYHFKSGDTAITYDGDISTGYEVNQVSRYLFPSGHIHKIAGKYQMHIMAGADSASAISRIIESTDMINWTSVQALDVSSYKPSDATYMYITDAVVVSGRCFMVVVRGYSSNQDIGFYELTDTSLVNIPLGLLLVAQQNLASYGTNLLVRDNVIYGSFGRTLFRYDIATDTYTDMTRDALMNLCYNLNMYTGKVYNPSVTTQCSNAFITSVLEYTESGYTRTVPASDMFFIENLSWDTRENAILISISIGVGVYMIAPMYYYSEDNSYRLLPLKTDTSMAYFTNSFFRFSLYSDQNTSIFCYGGYVVSYGAAFNKPKIELPNPSMNEVSYQNLVSTYIAKLPLYYSYPLYQNLRLLWSLVDTPQNGVKEQWIASQAILHPDKPMVQVDSETLTVNSIYPIFDCRKIAVREYSDRLEILLLSVDNTEAEVNSLQDSYAIYSGYGAFANATVFREYDSLQGCDVYFTSKNIAPFLTIYKDSEEYMPAEVFWNFPAQLTAREDVKRMYINTLQMPISNVKGLNE